MMFFAMLSANGVRCFPPLPEFQIQSLLVRFQCPCFDDKHQIDPWGRSFISTGDEAEYVVTFPF